MSLFDNSKHEMTIPPGCPWHKAQQSYGAPNVNWCEDTHCSYINEPANTWSNLGYIIIALYLFKSIKNKYVQYFSLILFFTGFASGVYHATNNYLTQIVDLVGMNLISSFLISFSLVRIFKNYKNLFLKLFLTLSFLNLILMFFLEQVGIALQIVFIIQYISIFSLETLAGFKNKSLKGYSYFAISLVIIALGQVAAQIDLKRVYCNPENLILHGHVIWHLLSALSMFFVALHINRFSKEIS